MKKYFFLSLSLFLTSLGYAQKGKYYQQHASYNMDIDVDVNNYTYHGKQSITYTNNSPDELKEVYFHLYWNAFKPNSMMDERVRNQGDNADKRLVEKNKAGKVVSRLASIPEGKEGNQKVNWIKQNGKELQLKFKEPL